MAMNRERYVLLNLIQTVGSNQWRRLFEAFGGPEAVCAATARALQEIGGISPDTAQRIADGCQREQRACDELAMAQQDGVTIITLDEPGYPELLRAIHDPPLVLYLKGKLPPREGMTVAVVGSRRASLYGLFAAEHLAYDLALRGVSVVSGLARGVDAAAHRGALKGDGETFAVLGNGLASIYPPEHAALASEVGERGGIISEYPMGMGPLPHNFPRRNRIISGLCHGVVVVEAATRSGALITADCALEQGREVFAVPGPITTATSQGTHRLIKQGAKLVASVEDILEELRPIVPEPVACAPIRAAAAAAGCSQERRAGAAKFSSAAECVLSCLSGETPVHIDAISAQSGLTSGAVSSALLELELGHVVRQLPGTRFVRRTPRGPRDGTDGER